MTAPAYVAGRNFPRSILTVDDDPILREICATKLALPGVTVDQAADGDEAMGKISQGYDLVVLDLEMPKLDGLGVLKKLRQLDLRPSPQVIVLSSRSDSGAIAAAFELGTAGYALKPVNWDALLSKISQVYLSPRE